MLSRLYSPTRRKNREDGFTLIELLIVVIIIGILAAIALPIFLNQQKAAVDGSIVSDVRNTVDNVQTWLVKNTGTAEASTSAWLSATDAGKPVITGTNTVGVKINTDGSYAVCGYNANGSQYKTTGAAYNYNSANGTFGGAACTTGSDTGGTNASIKAAASTFSIDLTSTNGWTSGSQPITTGSDANGNYIQVNGVAAMGANGYVAYNFDQSKTVLTAGHKYVVTFKSGMTSTSGFMFGNAAGVNTTGPFYSGTLANPGSGTTPTINGASPNSQFIFYCPSGTTLRIYGLTIQDVS